MDVRAFYPLGDFLKNQIGFKSELMPSDSSTLWLRMRDPVKPFPSTLMEDSRLNDLQDLIDLYFLEGMQMHIESNEGYSGYDGQTTIYASPEINSRVEVIVSRHWETNFNICVHDLSPRQKDLKGLDLTRN